MKKFFSNEIVFRGHPDKVCDQISDALLDEYLTGDKSTRAGIEVTGGKGIIFITGEVTSNTEVDVEKVVRGVLEDVGYSTQMTIINNIGKQSNDIAQGVDIGGAGDQGMTFGYASNATPEKLPVAMVILQKYSKIHEELRAMDKRFLPDGKCQITGKYDEDFNLESIETFLINYQVNEKDRQETDKIMRTQAKNLCSEYGLEIKRILINPTGKFEVGGFEGDAGLCLSGETLVYTQTGLRKMKELEKGLSVYTEKGKAKIVEYHKNGIKPTRIIEDERGQEIEATLNHPFRVWDGEDIVWRECGVLKKGDVLVKKRMWNLETHRNYIREGFVSYKKLGKEIKLKFNTDLAYILGWLVGDGNMSNDDRVTFYYGNEDERKHIEKELKKVFPETELNNYEYQDDRYCIYSKDLVNVFSERLGVSRELQPGREIPKSILRSSGKIKESFISGLFDSDGTIVTGTGRGGEHMVIALATSSKLQAQQVGVVLHSIGIQNSIDEYTVEGHYKTEKEYIKGGVHYRVRVCGLASIRKFLTNIGFRLESKREKYQQKEIPRKWRYNDYLEYPIYNQISDLLLLDSKKHSKYFENYVGKGSEKGNRKYQIENIDYMLDMYAEYSNTSEYKRVKELIDNYELKEIKSIKNGKTETYDITLDDETHSFIANGFIVHNTGRKIVVDAYQGFAPVGGGAQSGKDATKVDRSGAYKARQIAKRMLEKHNLNWCEVQLSYAIGIEEPMAVYIDSNKGIIEVTEEIYEECKPKNMIKDLGLQEPKFYETAKYGHFGDGNFSWER